MKGVGEVHAWQCCRSGWRPGKTTPHRAACRSGGWPGTQPSVLHRWKLGLASPMRRTRAVVALSPWPRPVTWRRSYCPANRRLERLRVLGPSVAHEFHLHHVLEVVQHLDHILGRQVPLRASPPICQGQGLLIVFFLFLLLFIFIVVLVADFFPVVV